MTEVFGSSDKVAMVGYYEGTNKATGHPFKAHAAHIWTVKNGKLIHFSRRLIRQPLCNSFSRLMTDDR
ncbi:MAG TPA: hypothetical protein VII28_06375 [Puia sp.]